MNFLFIEILGIHTLYPYTRLSKNFKGIILFLSLFSILQYCLHFFNIINKDTDILVSIWLTLLLLPTGVNSFLVKDISIVSIESRFLLFRKNYIFGLHFINLWINYFFPIICLCEIYLLITKQQSIIFMAYLLLGTFVLTAIMYFNKYLNLTKTFKYLPVLELPLYIFYITFLDQIPSFSLTNFFSTGLYTGMALFIFFLTLNILDLKQ